MNTPNPLIPQGSLERQTKGKSTVRIAIFTIVSIHAVFFAGLLIQGCRPDAAKSSSKLAESTNQNALPPLEGTTPYTSTQEVAQAAPPPVVSNVPPPATEPIVTTPPPAVSEPVAEGKPYKIAKGDTLAKIAKANGVSLKAMTTANPNVDPAKLKVGQTIQIPAVSASTAALGFSEPGKSEGGTNVHTVKAGETLTKIAKQHGTTPKAIRAANNLKTDRLLVGQKLKLPAPQSSTTAADGVKTSAVSKMSATNH
jgi:LysM repeat protein